MAVVYFDFDKEMQQMAIFLNAESDLLADRLEIRVKGMMASGMDKKSIVGVLRRELREGGQLFTGFNGMFKRNVLPSIDNVAQGAVVAENPDADEWEWITTSAKPCDDCAPRHGEVKEYREWEAIGLPRSGFSVCGDNCKCALVPAVQVGRSMEDGPVVVDPVEKAREEYKEKIKSDPETKARHESYLAEMREKRAASRR